MRALCCAVLLLTAAAHADDDAIDQATDAIEEATQFRFEGTDISLDLDFFITMDNIVVSQPPPGIIETGSHYLAAPRLSMLGDLHLTKWLSIFALGDVDRGFDPTDGDVQLRPDEYFMRADPFEGIFKVTVGKVATGYGQWVNRHFSWVNPMVNAPVAYEWITAVNATNGRVANKNAPDMRSRWQPAIWGPSYTTGIQFNGTIETFDYAFEVKNNSLGSSPNEWDLWNHGFYGDALTYTGRVGWRSITDFNFGLSASTGAYLNVGAAPNWEDFKQTVVGLDISWAHGPFEVWSEVLWSQWDVRAGPFSRAGTVGLASYFIEGKWKFLPGWWLSGRWNQQFPGDKPLSNESWDSDVYRIEACVGWRLNRSITLKTQYSYAHETGPVDQGENFFDLQLVFAF